MHRLFGLCHNNKDLAADFHNLFKSLPPSITLIEPGLIKYNFKWEIPRKKNLYISRLYQYLRFKNIFTDAGNLLSYADREGEFIAKLRSINGSVLIISGCGIGGYNHAILKDIFRPSEEVAGLIRHKTQAFDKNTVGIHIRRTDNSMSIEHSPLSLFIEEMRRCIDGNSMTNFFVASDDATIIDKLSEEFGSRVIPGDCNPSRTNLRGMLHATADLWALSQTCHIIGSYHSSYSEMAAMLGNVPLTILRK